jgi:hydrogenase maturation protein HypF
MSVTDSANGQHDAIAARLYARRFVLAGGVQGLGVRPAIFRLATQLGLAGCVKNSPRGVEIEVEGSAETLKFFARHLPRSLPGSAALVGVQCERMRPAGRSGFSIVKEPTTGPLLARVPMDRAVCPECLREIEDSADRRYEYGFTSCTQCGPRYTVIRSMPFERAESTMAEFAFCDDCRNEYERAGDRRFHAQTTACPRCGPKLWSVRARQRHEGKDAISAAVRSLQAGEIVALRGLGGYQLLVDATNNAAVERLRQRKGRLAKPLAVMVETTDAARRIAQMNQEEAAAFEDVSASILLARAIGGSRLSAAIHPNLNSVGVMRPTTPLHAILARDISKPLVCTSGNQDGDPLQYHAEASEKQLANLADCWLHHDRAIERPVDDSVVRVIAGRRVSIRLARGLAPLPLDLPSMPPTLALGGFLKAAVAWSNGFQAVLGPHIGDQQSIAARERFLAHLKDCLKLYRFRPSLVVHDFHPDYFSTQWAEKQRVRRLAVQHHHAHIAAGMLEHGWLDQRVIGVAWDGTGYGTDGTIWGGEFLVCEGAAFERVGRVRPFSLPGGEAAIHEPWRIAVSVCRQLEPSIDPATICAWNVDGKQVGMVRQIVDRPNLSPVTSSAGRLIDAAAALILGIDRADFDGQAAMRLEAAADRDARGWYHFPIAEEEMAELDWRPLFAGLLSDLRRGVEPATVAMRFHRSLAHGIVGICRRWDELPVVLSGGVFQNKLLTELVAEMIDGDAQPLGLPGVIPPNDGGLAAGQLAIAALKGRN